tara:strand:- start:611 stop:1357 length:747 start_codon:yes stop_codon:yes gene_type:complete
MISLLIWLRALLFIPYIIVSTLFAAIMVIVLAHGVSVPMAMAFTRQFWARPLLWFLGVDLEVRGLENLHLKKGSIVVFNHSSHMDIPILFASSPKDIFFGAKIELFKIPFFGQAMSAVGALPIDRSQRAKVMKVYEAAIPRLHKGDSFALAPEGTRQKEPRLGTFRKGPFQFATFAEAPLQPVVISGAIRLLPSKKLLPVTPRWKNKVIVEFLGQIVTHKEDDPIHLLEVAHSHMGEKLYELNGELGV